MSTRTYTTQIKGHPVALKLSKDLAKRVCGEIETALKVPGHWVEVTGIIGGDEHRSQLWTPFGGAPVTVADPEAYAADCAALIASLPELITESNAQDVVNSARAVFKKHLPIDDQRETPEAHHERLAEQNAQIEENEARHAAFHAAQVAKYGDSPEPITVPEGYTAITIELNYNDSDGMSDYYAPHHGYGLPYLLALVKGRPARTEKLHRDIVAKFPELAALSWTWNTENYSMGHGNWLESSVVDEAQDVTTYGGHTAPALWWEVSQGYNKSYVPFRGYARSLSSQPAPVATPAAPSGDCAYTVTYERDWTWISFPCKPAPEVLETLRTNGARWGNNRKAWYFRSHMEETTIAQWLGYSGPVDDIPQPEPPAQELEVLLSSELPTAPISDPEPAPAPAVLPSRFALLGDD